MESIDDEIFLEVMNPIAELNDICQRDDLKVNYKFEQIDEQLFICEGSVIGNIMIWNAFSKQHKSKKLAKREVAVQLLGNFKPKSKPQTRNNTAKQLETQIKTDTRNNIKNSTQIFGALNSLVNNENDIENSMQTLDVPNLKISEEELNKIFVQKMLELTLAYQQIRSFIAS